MLLPKTRWLVASGMAEGSGLHLIDSEAKTARSLFGSGVSTVRADKTDMESVVLAFDEALGKVMKRIVEWALPAPGIVTRPGRG